jgi:anti-sigma B factor antagonist
VHLKAFDIEPATRSNLQYQKMNSVQITSTKDGGIVSVYLSEQALDASNVQRFRHETASMFDNEKYFIFVLKDLKFVDSSGIGALLSCLRKAHGNGGDMKLAEVPDNVKSLFELVRMDRLFELFDTKDAAAASFRS